MELHPSKFDRVHQDDSIRLKLRATRPVREVVTTNASTSTHRNVAVQTNEKAQEFRNPRTLTPSGTWRRRYRYRCKPYRGRGAMTIPIAPNSTQEKEFQEEEMKILSITSLKAQLQRIRQQQKKRKREKKKNTSSKALASSLTLQRTNLKKRGVRCIRR